MNDSQDERTRQRAVGDGRVRSFLDADGLRWSVWEQPFSAYDRRNGLSLIFSSELAVRRVRDYPADWAGLSDEALAKLSWGV